MSYDKVVTLKKTGAMEWSLVTEEGVTMMSFSAWSKVEAEDKARALMSSWRGAIVVEDSGAKT